MQKYLKGVDCIRYFMMKAASLCILLCTLGCARFAPRLPQLAIPFPQSTQAPVAVSTDLQMALHELCGQGTNPANGKIIATIVAITQSNELVDERDVAYGAWYEMTVDVHWVRADGSTGWQGRVSAKRLVHKPLQQQSYAATFAYTRTQVCYDIARRIREQIVSASTQLTTDVQ